LGQTSVLGTCLCAVAKILYKRFCFFFNIVIFTALHGMQTFHEFPYRILPKILFSVHIVLTFAVKSVGIYGLLLLSFWMVSNLYEAFKSSVVQ